MGRIEGYDMPFISLSEHRRSTSLTKLPDLKVPDIPALSAGDISSILLFCDDESPASTSGYRDKTRETPDRSAESSRLSSRRGEFTD